MEPRASWRTLLAVFWILAAGYVPTLGYYSATGCRIVAAGLGLLLAFHLDYRWPERRRFWFLLPLLASTLVVLAPLLTSGAPMLKGAGTADLVRYTQVLLLAWCVYLVWALHPVSLKGLGPGRDPVFLGAGWLALGILLGDGPVGHAMMTAGVALMGVGLVVRRLAFRSDLLLLAASLGLCMWIGYVDYQTVWSPAWFTVDIRLLPYSLWVWVLAGLLAATYLLQALLPRWQVPAFASWTRLILLVGLLFSLRLLLLMGCREPLVDAFDIMQEGCRYLVTGHNPYAHQTYLSDFLKRVHSSPENVADQYQHTFGYPPGILLMSLPGYLLFGDIRYNYFYTDIGLVLLWLGIAGWRGRAPPTERVQLMVLLYLFIPGFPLMLGVGWTDPFVVPWLSLIMLLLVRKRMRWAFVCLGAAPVVKHLALPMVPAVLRSEPPRRLEPWLCMLAGAALLILPFALGNGPEFGREMLATAAVAAPLDSLCLWVYLFDSGWSGVTASGMTAIGIALAFLGWLVQRPTRFGVVEGTTLSLLVLFFLGRWAYLNYYWFVIAMLLLAMLMALPEEPEGSLVVGEGA